MNDSVALSRVACPQLLTSSSSPKQCAHRPPGTRLHSFGIASGIPSCLLFSRYSVWSALYASFSSMSHTWARQCSGSVGSPGTLRMLVLRATSVFAVRYR